MSTPETSGGFYEWTEVDEEGKEICEKVKDDVEKKTKMKFTVYVPLGCRSRKVNPGFLGTGYTQYTVYVGKDLCVLIGVERVVCPGFVGSLTNATLFHCPPAIVNDTP